MQNMSSKDELMLQASELFDGHCHQPSQVDEDLLASDEVKDHLKNWSLIGSALRHELPPQINVNFAQNVMDRIEAEEQDQQNNQFDSDAHDLDEYKRVTFNMRKAQLEREREACEDQCDYVRLGRKPEERAAADAKSFFTLKRLLAVGAQTAIAASVAVVAVVGLQIYNASDLSVMDPASTASTNTTAIGGVSLASYQNANSDMVMDVEPVAMDTHQPTSQYQADIRQQKKEELERINLYVKGYMSDIAVKD